SVFASGELCIRVNWTEEMNTMIDESLMMSEEIMEQYGSAAQIEDQMKQIREQMKNLTLLIPPSITIISIFLSLITTLFSHKIINRVENKQHYYIPFKLFNLPMSV